MEQAQIERIESEQMAMRRSAGPSSKFSSHKVSTHYGAFEQQSKHSHNQANPEQQEGSPLVISEENATIATWQDLFNYFKFGGGWKTMVGMGLMTIISLVNRKDPLNPLVPNDRDDYDALGTGRSAQQQP